MDFYKSIYGVDISIKLKNGIYTFYDESASGKTRLFNLLKCLADLNSIDVTCITYTDILKNGVNAFDNINKNPLAFLDRVDMYKDKIPFEKLIEASNSTVILMDCKSEIRIMHKYASIYNVADTIIVDDL